MEAASELLSVPIFDGRLSIDNGFFGTEIYLGVGADFDDMLNRARYGRIYTIGDKPAPSAADSPVQLPAPTVTTSATSIDIAGASSDAACTGASTANVTGKFTGLNPNTSYCYKVDFDTLTGGPANFWSPAATTASPPPPLLPARTKPPCSSKPRSEPPPTASPSSTTAAMPTACAIASTTSTTTAPAPAPPPPTAAVSSPPSLPARPIATVFVSKCSMALPAPGSRAASSAPTLTSTPHYTNQNSVTVEVNGEAGAAVWVNGLASGLTLAASGKASLALDTTGADGVKSFALTLKDAAGNASGALAVSIEKGTVAPESVAFVTSEPDQKGTTYSGITIAGDKNFSGATVTVTSRNGGTIFGVSIDGSGRIVISSYDTPNANPDYLDIAGTDKYGNAIAIALRVNLPN